MTDKDLDKMLEQYCAAEPDTSFEYKPSHRRAGPVASSKNRLLAAAAAIALISAVGIGAYTMFGNRFDVSTAVEPKLPTAAAKTTESKDPTENNTAVTATEPHTSAPATEATQTASLRDASAVGSQNTSNTVIVYQINEVETPADQSVTESVSAPTPQPTVISTEAPTQQLTESVDEPPLTRPTESDIQPVGVSFSGVVDSSMLTGSGNVYSRIFDDRGRLLGDSDAYSPDRLAVIVEQDGDLASVQYTVPEDLLYKEGYYNIVFYNEDGKRLAQGQLYIQPFDTDE